jgi:hypothetical protein
MKRKAQDKAMAYGRDEFISCCSRGRMRKQHHDCDQRPISLVATVMVLVLVFFFFFCGFSRAIRGICDLVFVADAGDDYVTARLEMCLRPCWG